MERYFYDQLNQYGNRSLLPMHMPGHKRKFAPERREAGKNFPPLHDVLSGCYAYDVTELPGLDDLHDPSGALADSLAQAADIYGSYRSFYLINGTTVGILASVAAACTEGGTILMARNCHMSVYHAVLLNHLNPVYLYPEVLNPHDLIGSISPAQVEHALMKHPEIEAVILPSPTYEGVVSDIEGIAEVVHRAGATLIVDAAHGAHLEFFHHDADRVGNSHHQTPNAAIRLNADLVIESLHKTLSALTQCAILHIGNPAYERRSVDNLPEALAERIKRYLSVYETTSPSYLLVASIEDAVVSAAEMQGDEFAAYAERLNDFREAMHGLSHLHLVSDDDVRIAGGFAYDETKLLFTCDADISYTKLAEILESEYGIVVEMCTLHGIVLISTVWDTAEDLAYLAKSLRELDHRLYAKNPIHHTDDMPDIKTLVSVPEIVCTPTQAYHAKRELIDLDHCIGKICADYIVPYPPGIPLLTPGEKISVGHIIYIRKCVENGIHIHGIKDRKMRVL